MNYPASEVAAVEMKFEMKDVGRMAEERGLAVGGRVQKFVDNECIRLMVPYTPMVNGALVKSVTQGTVIGSGRLEYVSPYARYLYYGKLMVSKETGSSWAKHGESKVLTDKELKYSMAEHPQAGKLWFERMKADHKDKILAGARRIAGGGA